jgi:hypothetical protein
MTTLGTLTLKEKDEIETKLDKPLFLRSNLQGDRSRKPHCQRCLEDTQGSFVRQDSYIKINLQTLHLSGPKEEFWNLERTFPRRVSRKTCDKKLLYSKLSKISNRKNI